MADLILYHYPLSPFSEKVRSLLGYAGIPWHSVTVREMPPRPELEALAGGYRKIPVAQVGADVFCDTRTIAREIARLASKPELILERQPLEIQQFVEQVDLEIFLAAVVYASGPGVLWKLIKTTSPLHAARFLKDRIEIGRKARVPAVSPSRARQVFQQHLERMEGMLTRPFLFGDKPCIADFSAYHSLWFVAEVAGKPVLKGLPAVSAWMKRMHSFGHGDSYTMDSEEALGIAQQSAPRDINQPGLETQLYGQTVSVAPTDYGRDPVVGQLVHASDDEWVIAHTHPRVGQVHLHFPRAGFKLAAR